MPQRLIRPLVSRLSLAALLALSCSVVSAQEAGSVAGVWQSEGKEATFDVQLWGDGTQLCGKLLALRPDVVNDDNKSHLGQTIIDNARATGPNTWTGGIHYLGYDLQGTIVLQSPQRIQLNGCLFVVLCKTFYLNRQTS